MIWDFQGGNKQFPRKAKVEHGEGFDCPCVLYKNEVERVMFRLA